MINVYLHNGTASGKRDHVEREDDSWVGVLVFILLPPRLSSNLSFSLLQGFLLVLSPCLLKVMNKVLRTGPTS